MAQHKRTSLFSFATLFAAALAMSFTACTKTKETKSMVDPAAYVAKVDFEGKTFSLVRGVEDADSNNIAGVIPGMSDDFGFVKVRITETEIQFIEVFNPYNKQATQSVLASYAIKDHFDIQRDVNDFQESTHKIVEKKERPWAQRQFMRVDWSNPNNEKSRLWQWNEGTSVKTELENLVLLSDPKVENGHISWLTEFSISGGIHWWGTETNSRAVVRTHLMPVKVSDFVPLNHSNRDFGRFGLFHTKQLFEDPEKGLTDSGVEKNTFANVHNVCEAGRTDTAGKPLSCSTNKIVWHLTKGFPERYRASARQAVTEWNETFKLALGRTDDVVTLDESLDVDMIDPRRHAIAFYSEKSPGGLLGVAQEVINPQTGETIASRATVYQDGINYTLSLVDDIVTMILQDDELRKTFLATDFETKERVATLLGAKNFLLSGNQRQKAGINSSARRTGAATSFEARRTVKDVVQKMREPIGRSVARKEALMKKAPELFATTEQAKLGRISGFDEAFGLLGATKPADSRITTTLDGLEQLHDVGSSLREERARMLNQAATGMHGAELVEEATLSYIKKVLAAHPDAADFKAQVAKIKADVEVKTFYSTLLHEMGHTFGLRHNFQASADAKHYHPEFHRLSKQMDAEKELPADQKTVTQADLEPYMFSSIMDYAADFYSHGGLGTYDHAAIRYAYNRSIDKETDAVTTANFQFCTDHQVNESILCRRFDKGRNVSEITFNLIETYQTNYLLSHNRRDRFNFGSHARSFPMRALGRYFIPIRQVMDEGLFALIAAKTVAAGENECDVEYWRKSVDAGEIVNVCNPVQAEQNGVDPTNLESFEAGLFNQKGLRKNPIEYTPYGLADLLFANVLAKQFYTEVLGSTAPGTYIAEPISENVFHLQKLPEGKSVEEALSTFASDRGLDVTPELLAGMKNLVGEVKPGRFGKNLESKWDESNSQPRQTTIGSFWDKYVAMLSLGLKDIGVDKYSRHSMTGNAYAFPGTKGFAQNIMKAMIIQKERLVTIPFTTPAGVIPAMVEPALNVDIRAIATITAMTDFISDIDKTMVAKMSVCSVDEKGCLAPFAGQKVAEFMTASGQNVFRAAQTQNKDSIVFDLVEAAAKIDKDRKEWVVKLETSSDIAADNIMKLTELTPMRASLEKTLAALDIKEMNKILPTLLSDDPKKPSMWGMLNVFATQGEKIPVFITMNMAQQANGVINAAATILGKEIQALDPKKQCPPPVAPTIEEPGSKLPGVVGLGAAMSGRTATFASRSPFWQAIGENPAPPANEAKKNEPAIDCNEVEAKRAVLMAAGQEFQQFATGVSSILNGGVEAKLAPLRVKRLTDELERAEADVTFIRLIAKATGLQ